MPSTSTRGTAWPDLPPEPFEGRLDVTSTCLTAPARHGIRGPVDEHEHLLSPALRFFLWPDRHEVCFNFLFHC